MQSQFPTQDGSSSFLLLSFPQHTEKHFFSPWQCRCYHNTRTNKLEASPMTLVIIHSQNSTSHGTAWFVRSSNVSPNTRLIPASNSNWFVLHVTVFDVWNRHIKGKKQTLLFHLRLLEIHMQIRTHNPILKLLDHASYYPGWHFEKYKIICISHLF